MAIQKTGIISEHSSDNGLAWGQIAEVVGVSESALTTGEKKITAVTVSVGVTTLISPGGYRIEGPGVDELAALVTRIDEFLQTAY